MFVGNNGSGKSTLTDALTFALFGKPFRNINKANLINSINDKEMLTEVEFRIGNKEYLVRRGLKPSVFEVYCDGKMIDQNATAKDYQDNLENNIIKLNYKAFTQIVIIGSSSFVPFMKLSAYDRRMLIEDLLDIRIFSSMNIVLKNKQNFIRDRIFENQTNINTVMTKIDLQKKYIEDSKRNNQEQIDRLITERDSNKNQIEQHQNALALIQRHINVLSKQIEDEPIIKSKSKKLLEFENKIDNNKSKIEKELNFYKDNNSCPTCKQNIDAGFKEIKIREDSDKLLEFNRGLNKIKTEQDSINERIDQISKVHKHILNHQSEMVKINSTIIQINKYIDKLNTDIDDLQTKKPISEDMISVSEELIKELEKLNNERIDLLEKRKYYDMASSLLKDNGIKAKIIKQYLPLINKLTNKYLSAMEQFINFEIDEEFNETIKSRYRDDFSYGNFSEGEKMRIDLSLLFTWRAIAKVKNSLSTNLLILDEVFDSSLDLNGTEEFMRLLELLDDTNVFVISHKGDVLIDKFKSVIKFEKVNNFSRIV